MIDLPTIARANAISVEAKLTRHSKRSDGGINIGLAIHPHGIPQALIDAQLGDRFMVALVQIDEHEQPVQQPKEEASQNISEPAPAHPNPARARNRLAQRAGMLCNDKLFQKFIRTQFPNGYIVPLRADENPNNPVHVTAAMLRDYCNVDSRADILPSTEAATRLDLIESAFICDRDRDRYVEAS